RLIQSMRFTSAFNIIGPLTRPCEQNNCIVIGAYSPHVCDQLIAVLKEIGMPMAVAPYGMVDGIETSQGMDEFSLSGMTRVVQLLQGKIETYEVTPNDFGLKTVDFHHIESSRTGEENADRILAVLRGQYDSPEADFFCMNAAAALYISRLAQNYKDGTNMAKEALATGKALEKLEELREFQGAKTIQ
ncbi:anthranilate phosphoribosyltransferase, partial [bacterium]|nr:anthranilate phosphoribosyltransferase [bacterium]